MLVPLRGCTCLKCTNREVMHYQSGKCANRANVPVCFVGAAETAAPPASSSHGTHSCLGCSPTDFTDLHRCWCLLGGALVSSAPTEQVMHYQGGKYTNRSNVPVCFVGAAETAAPPIAAPRNSLLLRMSPTDFTDLHRCWCLLGGALVSSAPTE